MKKFFWMPALVLGALAVQSCNNDDNPRSGNEQVESAFTAMYPNATRTDWERKGDYFVVDFRKDAKELEAWFGQNGEWFLTETDLTFQALPEPIRTAFAASEYKAWRVDDVDMLERKDMETVYVLDVESGAQEYDLYYSADGTLIKAVPDTNGSSNNGQYIPTALTEKVKTYIASTYPQARVLETETEKGLLEVDIIDGTTHRELHFNAGGDWVLTETKLRRDAVPQNVMAVLNASAYAAYSIDDVYLVTTPQASYYYFELESGSKDVDLTIDLQGTLNVVR